MQCPNDSWSLCVGRWRGVDVRLHATLPLLAMILLLAVHAGLVRSSAAGWGLIVLTLCVALCEFIRAIAAVRVGGHASSLVLAPVTGFSRVHLPLDPPAHLVTALAGPMTLFVIMVSAGCCLSLAKDREVLRLLVDPHHPQLTSASTAMMVGQLFVWISWCLLLVSLLPIEPCAGAEILSGVLWPVVGRASAASATSHVALGMALICAMFAMVLSRNQIEESSLLGDHTIKSGLSLPGWFPFAIGSVVLLYGAVRQSQSKRYDVGLAIDEFESDDEDWLLAEWIDEDRATVLVEHPRDKQQEAIDRKRREREASEDARVDAILERMRDTSFDQLSEEERAVLKRASRRYRQRRHPEGDD